MRKILIDCSLIKFSPTPTGIPRVVTNYLVNGIQWGKEHGYEVVPIDFYGKEMIFPLIPKPLAKIFISPIERFNRCIVRGLHQLIERIRRVLFHILSALGYLFFLDGNKLDQKVNWLLEGYVRCAQLLPYLLERQFKRIVPHKSDVLFCPSYWHDVDPDIYREIKKQGCKIVFLVHDILPVLHPQYYHYPWLYYFEQNLRESFSYTDKYFTVSNYTRNCLIDFAKSKCLPEREVSVVMNGLDNLGLDRHAHSVAPTSPKMAGFLEKYPTFLLMVGSIEPKKGHTHIIEQLMLLWDDGYDLPLLVAGRKGWMYEGVVKLLKDPKIAGKRVFWFNDLKDKDLAIAYSRARFLIFGSDAEGFGLPMIEALHFGCPVIANDTPIAREILGQFGLFYHKEDQSFRKLIASFSDEQAYGKLKASIKDFYWPSWKESTESLFTQLIKMDHSRSKDNITQLDPENYEKNSIPASCAR